MFDLTRTWERMLFEIDAGNASSLPRVLDPQDARFVSMERVCLVIRGTSPDELLPSLTAALSQRFTQVASKHLLRNLLYPLKKAVGNAYKWGNDKDPDKSITVEAVISDSGAVIAVSDKGDGFDSAKTLRKFREGEKYYTHGGSGFRHFDRMKSVVSYANGGRTLLIQFLCDERSGKV